MKPDLPRSPALSWAALRELSNRSFFHFVRIVNPPPPDCAPIDKFIHKPLCDFYQQAGTYRKVIAMPRDWLKCVHPGTLVQMADGSEKRISDISLGDRVAGYRGFEQTFGEVIGKWESYADLYEIEFRSGRVIKASGEHKFLQVDGSYKPLPKYGASPRGLKTDPRSDISMDDAALVSYMVAEGCLVSGNMSFTNGLEEVKKDFESLVERKGWSYIKIKRYGCNEYRLNGGKLRGKHTGTPREWARGHGIHGKSSREKTLPDSIMSSGPDIIKRVIEILFATDGSLGVYCRIPQISYCSVNKALCLQIQNLLNRYGVFSSVNFVNNKYGGAYHLRVNGNRSIVKFTETFAVIGKLDAVNKVRLAGIKDGPNTADNLLPDDTKNLVTETRLREGRGIRIDNHYRLSREKARKIESIRVIADADINWDDVVSCKPIGNMPTVDIETTTGNYVANGIITHNSTVFTKWGAIWEYLRDNEARVLIAAENERLAGRFLHWIQQQLLNNHFLREMYPELKQIDQGWVRSHRWSASECDLPRIGTYSEPTFTAIGVGGAAQSGHYTKVIIDDLVGKKAKESLLVLESVLRWFDNSPELLVQPHRDMGNPSTIQINGTFWFPGDFLCYVRDKYPEFEFRVVPCRKRDPKSKFENLIYVQNPEAEMGESNWDQFPTEYYVQMLANPEKNIDYWAQHMNDPEQASELTNFDTAWLKYYRIETRESIRYIVCEDDKEEFRMGSFPIEQFVDPGGFSDKRLTKTGSRFATMSGGQPLNSHKKFITYAHAFRFKEPDKAMDEVFKCTEFFKPVIPRIIKQESYGQQNYILTDIRKEAKKRGIPIHVVELPADENKDSKANNIDAVKKPMFNGELYIHNSMKDLISEIRVYPNGMTKDLVDLLGQMMKHCFKRNSVREGPRPMMSREAFVSQPASRVGY